MANTTTSTTTTTTLSTSLLVAAMADKGFIRGNETGIIRMLELIERSALHKRGDLSISADYLINESKEAYASKKRLGRKQVDDINRLLTLGLIKLEVRANSKYAAYVVSKVFIENTLGISLREFRVESLVARYKLGEKKRKLLSSGVTIKVYRKRRPTLVIDGGTLNVALVNAYEAFEWSLDLSSLERYKLQVQKSLIAKMVEERRKEAASPYDFDQSYEQIVARDVVNAYLDEPGSEYCLGGATLDQRGRANPKGQGKILNPVTFKIGRALMKIKGRTMTTRAKKAIGAIYGFIASELASTSQRVGKTQAEIEALGKELYLAGSESYANEELHIRIWMERVYSQLDELFEKGRVHWTTPIEIDFTFSGLMVAGLLLGHEEYMKETNCLAGNKFHDAWDLPNVSVREIGKALTARMYGSGKPVAQTSKALSQKGYCEANGINWAEECKATEIAWKSGKFALVRNMIELAKGSMLPAHMTKTGKYSYPVHFGGHTWEVHVAKSKHIATVKNNRYQVVAGSKDNGLPIFKSIMHDVEQVMPNAKAHLLFLPSGLNHMVDAYIMDYIVGGNQDVLPIHDAVILHPLDVAAVRNRARKVMHRVYVAGEDILHQYYDDIMSTFKRGVIVPDHNKAHYKAIFDVASAPRNLKEADFTGWAMK
jgi:hypothetical protein